MKKLIIIGIAVFAMVFGGCSKNVENQSETNKKTVNIVYCVSDSEGDYSEKDLESTISTMEDRAKKYSEDASVAKDGDNIVASIPEKIYDESLPELLMAKGELYFCTEADAKPTDEQLDNKEYVEIDEAYYKVWVTGADVEKASGNIQESDVENKDAIVSINFTADGAKTFADMTSENMGQMTYIVYDGMIIASPMINAPITDGSVMISGMDSIETAEILAANIESGTLALQLEVVSSK